MPRHRFDPVALVFGAVFVAGGLTVLAGGELIEEGRALVPAGLIALGVALLVQVVRRSRPQAPARAVAQPAPWEASDRDLDALFAPIDDTLADWDREHAATGRTNAVTDATHVDATDVDATEVDATEVDTPGAGTGAADPADVDATDVDATEVVDPTERYPRSEPE